MSDFQQIEYLQSQYEKVVSQLETAIDAQAEAKNKVEIANATVKKLDNMKNLILENIRCEKKRMETLR